MTNKELEVLPYLLYKYAEIDLSTGECVGVVTASRPKNEDRFVEIPHLTMDYVGKYYIDGAWYEDAEGTIPWSPAE